VFETGEKVSVTPSLSDLELHQFTQFASARIRFALKEPHASVEEFMQAMQGTGNEVEDFFKTHAKFTYIEGRDAGATFPDTFIKSQPNGDILADTMALAPLALQIGIVRNADAVFSYIQEVGWATCLALKEAAIRDGLAGRTDSMTVAAFAQKILTLAKEGLEEDERVYLSYPEYVLSSGKNASERLLERYHALTGEPRERIQKLVQERAVAL
jgi:gamma-glutamylcysteine synthetase